VEATKQKKKRRKKPKPGEQEGMNAKRRGDRNSDECHEQQKFLIYFQSKWSVAFQEMEQ
jgi:hypothetical protein